MPLYYYEAFTRSGDYKSGVIDAVSPQNAKELIRSQGLIPSQVSLSNGQGGGFSLSSLFSPQISSKTLILFTRQLGVLLKSGVPLLQAFELLTEQFEQPFYGILISIKEGIKSGESLASQLAAHPHIFPNVYIQLVRAGEATGKLDMILARLTLHLTRAEETRKQVKSALSKPKMMGVAILGAVFAILTFVVPKLSGMFDQMKQELPMPTQILLATSRILQAYYIPVLVVLALLIVVFNKWRSTEQGRFVLDTLKIQIPLISFFTKTQAVVQFSQTLGMLLESGVNLSEALDIVTAIIDNTVLAVKIREARDNIIKEGKIARYLKETDIFPGVAIYMIKTGEESGKLGEMLTTVGNDYDAELRELSQQLTESINPVMTIVMGLVIGFIVMAIMLPIAQMGDAAGRM